MGASMIWAGIPEGIVMWLLNVFHYGVGLVMDRPFTLCNALLLPMPDFVT